MNDLLFSIYKARRISPAMIICWASFQLSSWRQKYSVLFYTCIYLFFWELFLCHRYWLCNLQVWEDADRTLWRKALMSGNLMRKWKDDKMEMGMYCLLVFIGLTFYMNYSCLWMNVISLKSTFKSMQETKPYHHFFSTVKFIETIKQNIYRKQLNEK